MNKGIIGGIVSVVIGGTSYAISKTDIVTNFSRESGMSQQDAQKYVENVQGNLSTFSDIGNSLIDDGNSGLSSAKQIDCENYAYDWETPTLNCTQGVIQFTTIGNDEVTLGNCYKALGTDLGSAAKSKISECIQDIDAVNQAESLPIASALLDNATITDERNTNIYNKSVLQAALK